MPGSHIALIRGINVGRAKRIAMADLRELVEYLGYRDVRTVLNTGNVIFSTRATPANAARKIEQAMVKSLGVEARVTVLTAEELKAMIEKNPLDDIADNPSRMQIAILSDAADRSTLKPLLEQDWGADRLARGTRAVYLWCPNGIAKSALYEAVSRALADGVTTRNLATMQKILSIVESD